MLITTKFNIEGDRINLDLYVFRTYLGNKLGETNTGFLVISLSLHRKNNIRL